MGEQARWMAHPMFVSLAVFHRETSPLNDKARWNMLLGRGSSELTHTFRGACNGVVTEKKGL